MPLLPRRSPRPLNLQAVLLGAVLLATACSAGPPASAGPAARAVDEPARSGPGGIDPAARSGRASDAATAAEGEATEIRLTIPVGTAPDGAELAVEIRSVEAGGRRHVVIDTPEGLVDQHVVTEDEHWWWIPPMAREAIGEVTWIHIDVAQVEAAGGDLPAVVADARVPLPPPGAIPVGTPVAGHEVVAVDRVGPDEDHLTLAGLDVVAVLRRRALPAGTTIDLPAGAVELRDLPDAVHPELVPR